MNFTVNLTDEDRMDAYAAVKAHFGLKARQRSMLDICSSYGMIMFYAKNENWIEVEKLLTDEGII